MRQLDLGTLSAFDSNTWLGTKTKVEEDRTIRAMVAAALVGRVTKRVHHAKHFLHLSLQSVDLVHGEPFHISALATAVMPKGDISG